MQIKIEAHDTKTVVWRLQEIGKNAKEARRLWINWLGLEMQGGMRNALPARFHLRGTADGFRKAVVFRQAKKDKDDVRGLRQTAELVIGNNAVGGTKASATKNLGDILARHEDEETRTAAPQPFFNGRKKTFMADGFFIPTKGQRTSTTNPPRAQYPANVGAALRLTPDSKLILAKGTKKGSKRTGTGVSYFANEKGIFRRKHSGFGRANVEQLWFFQRRIHSPARLGLWVTAAKVHEQRAIPLGLQAIDEVLFRSTL